MFLLKLYTVWIPLILILVLALFARLLTPKHTFALRLSLLVLMLLSGILKQIYAIFTVYNVWYLPLHFSSTFYLTVGASIFGRGTLKRYSEAVLFTGGTIMIAMILITPQSVLGNLRNIFNSPITFHGYFYHLLIVFQYFILLFRNEYAPKLSDFIIFGGFVLAWGAIAVPCAFKLNANYMGILKSFIPFLEWLRLNYGYPLYFLTYYLCVLTLSFMLVGAYCFIHSAKPRKTELYRK